MVTNIEIHEINKIFYVKYVHNNIQKISQGFNTKDKAIEFELSLKFI